jgi:hypothetical protein
MSDPLSIAASVAGLIALSGKIITTLNNLYTLGKSGKNAPESIIRVLDEMKEMNGIFSEVQLIVVGNSKKPNQSRLAIISIDHFVATLSGCVLVCAKLDKYLKEVQDAVEPSLKATIGGKLSCRRERVRWDAWKESEISGMLGELQDHKIRLNLMLHIIQW